MNLQSRLLSVAVIAALAAAAPAFAAKGDHPAASRALGLIDGNPAATHRADADRFQVRDVIVDPDGMEHVRFNRTYRGLSVFGGDLVVHSKNGKLKSVTSALKLKARPDIAPSISKDQALVEAGAAFAGIITSTPEASLVIYARNFTPTLAYRVHVRGTRDNDQAEGNIVYYIDAKSGKVLLEDDQIRTAEAAGTGKTITLGNVAITTNSISGGYQLLDPSRGNGSTLDAADGSRITNRLSIFTDTDNIWGNNTNADRASAAADAHYGVTATWDYYKNVHGRNGIFNDGKGVKSYVHFGRNYVNAYWSGSYMVYGDGDGVTYLPLVALDVAGHEMTHGVTQATSELGYYDIKDSGGLNEASSDIMGSLVEFSVDNANDPGDYLIGEEIYASNPNQTKALRLMFKQDADGRSYSCYPTGGFTASLTGKNEQYDPHNTSGVGNRFFYLLAEGPVTPPNFSYTPSQLVCNGDTAITGIGKDKAGKIWYRAMDLYFVSNTDYPGARVATVQAATDLYGATSTEVAAVKRAWDAVSVN